MSTVQIPEELLQQLLASTTEAKRAPVIFEDWAQDWLRAYQQGRVKDNTFQSNYSEAVRLHLIPYFGGQALGDILPIQVQEFFKEKAKSSALESIKKMKCCLYGIFSAAIENGLCWRNPVIGIKLYSKIDPIKKNVWTAEQYSIAWQFARTHKNGLDIQLMMETAVSRSELLGFTWQDWEPSARILHVENGLVMLKDSETGYNKLVCDGLKNPYRHREIPLSREVAARLACQPRTLQVGGSAHRHIPPHTVRPAHIFCSPRGKPFSPTNWYRRVFQPFMRELTEKHPEVILLTPHELRHTRATLLKNSRVDIFSIARLLGHSNLEMVIKRYAHDDPEALRTALGL